MCPPAGRKTHGGVWLGPEVRGLSQLRFGHSSTELSPSPTQPEELWGKPSPLQLQEPAFSTSLQGSSHLPRGLRSPTRPRDKKEERKTGTGGQGLLRGPYRFPALQCPTLGLQVARALQSERKPHGNCWGLEEGSGDTEDVGRRTLLSVYIF